MSANSETDLYMQLHGMDVELVSCSEEGKGKIPVGKLGIIKVKIRDLIQMFMHLEQMDNAGVPLLSALEDVRESTDNVALKDVVSQICRDVSEGQTFTQTLRTYPHIFQPIYISLIESGEETGNMGDAFSRLVNYLKWREDMNSRIKKARRYPIILTVVITVVIGFMMGYVVPQIVEFIELMDQELPFPTIALIATSKFIVNYWYLIIGSVISLVVGIKLLRKSSRNIAYSLDQKILEFPVIGEMIRRIEIARFCQTFASLYDAGIDAISGLNSSRNTIQNLVLHETMGVVIQEVKNGSAISEALSASGEFPSMVVRMVRIGEESGNLTEVLGQVSEFYTKDVDDAIQGMIAYIEPTLLCVMGGIIAWIVIAVFGPVYDSFSDMPM